MKDVFVFISAFSASFDKLREEYGGDAEWMERRPYIRRYIPEGM